MSNVVVVGTQWGDEGKGKIVDLYAAEADVIARFQGGNNAGHTLLVEGKQTILHLIPSGILHNKKTCVLGNGMVIDPQILLQEIDELRQKELFPPDTRLFVSESAHVILPYHRRLDTARECLKGQARIGTTGKGIGPAYEDKIARVGIRICDLFDKEIFREKLERNIAEKNFYLAQYCNEAPVDGSAIFEEYQAYAERIRCYVANTSLIVNQAMRENKNVLFEGAQGSHLDIDHGTYPFVTSSNTIAGGACTGVGIGPNRIKAVVGICKAYTTRVGSGPFVTELEDEIGARLQKTGSEFGATTGRKRRCGWLDMVLVRQSIMLSGITMLALTKLDVLTGIETLKICVGYRAGKEEFLEHLPADIHMLESCDPVYEEIDGWSEDIRNVRRIVDLPYNARKYIDRLEELGGIPVGLVSVGAGRNETIVQENPFR